MLEPTKVRNEMKALQFHFREKRDYVLGRLEDMGFKLDYTPDSTFYIWLNLGALPQEINDGLNFFQACLKEKVIVVPGIFFDLNPSKRRDLFDSPCHHFVRVSYGPKVCFALRNWLSHEIVILWILTSHSQLETLKAGMDGFERVLKKYNAFPGRQK
jgi:aspartate/methionine/tyrosine aminotransferase